MHALHDRSKACCNFCTLPFYCSVFVDVMFHIHCKIIAAVPNVLVVFFIIMIDLFFLLYLVPLTHLHHADAHFTLLISAHPAISPHSLPSFVVIFFITLLAVGNCNVPVQSDLNCSHAQFICNPTTQ
jgi:hypothetical protein